MYGNHAFEEKTSRWVQEVEQCPASDGPGSKISAPQLDRWKATWEITQEWARTGDDPSDISDRLLAWMDPVQREIVESLFATYRAILPRRSEETYGFDVGNHTVPHPSDARRLKASIQASLTGPDGTELLKIKTGRWGTSEYEIAVLQAGNTDGHAIVEVSLHDGDLRTLHLEPDQLQEQLGGQFSAWDRHESVPKRDRSRRPGGHCFSCDRVAKCGQYPPVEAVRILGCTRTVAVAKTSLEKLAQCHRRVAWKRLYGIPEDDGDEEDGGRREVGVRFHDLMAVALLDDNPGTAFRAGVENAPTTKQSELIRLFEMHEILSDGESHPVAVRRTEYSLGVTFPVLGADLDAHDNVNMDARVAVVLTAQADAVGREPDGTPAVIEHRTGQHAIHKPYEVDLYALSAALTAGTDRAAVYIHRLGLHDGPACERVEYGPEELLKARERLSDAAVQIASWHPQNALDPEFTVGEWCSWCPFSERCSQFR